MLSFCKKQIKYFLVILMVMMVIFVFVLLKTPISEVDASGLIDNDTTNKVVTMTGTNYTMIFDYNLKAKITSFKQGTNEILDTQGIISAVNGTMGNTMGNTGEGSVKDSSSANAICAFKYTAGSSFTATSVHVKMYDAFSSGHFKVAIYSDNSGTPGSMLGTTNEYTSLAAGWNTLNLSSNVELTSGTSYWLIEWADSAYAIYGDVSGGTCKWDYYTYGAWPSGGSVSWTASPGNSSIYVSNTPGSGWVDTSSLDTSPSVSVNNNIVTATLSTSVANETWTFDVQDSYVDFKISRTYNDAYTVKMQGTPMINLNNSVENLRWPDDGGNMPLRGQAENLPTDYWIANDNAYFSCAKEQISFVCLGSTNSIAVKVTGTSNRDGLDRGRATQMQRVNGVMRLCVVVVANDLTYATGTSLGYNDGYGSFPSGRGGHGRPDGGDIYTSVNVTNGQNDWVNLRFEPATYNDYYDLGTLNGVDETALSKIINDYGRTLIIDKKHCGITESSCYWNVDVVPHNLWISPQIASIMQDNANTMIAVKNSFNDLRDYCQKDNGHIWQTCPGSTKVFDLANKYVDTEPGYVLGCCVLYNMTGDSTWLSSMKTSMEKALDYALSTNCDANSLLVKNYNTTNNGGFANDYWEQTSGIYNGYVSAMLYNALVRFAELENNVLSDSTKGNYYADKAATLKTSINKTIANGGVWSSSTNTIVYGTGNPESSRYLPAQTMGLMYDLLSKSNKINLLNGIETEDLANTAGMHPLCIYSVIPGKIGQMAGYSPGGEDGGWYGVADGDYYTALPLLNDRTKIPFYFEKFVSKSTGGSGYYNSGVYDRNMSGSIGFEKWFPTNVNIIYGFYYACYGFQPRYSELVLAPFISDAMIGSTVNYMWRGQNISVQYNSLYKYTITANNLPTNIRVRFINQTPGNSYSIKVDGESSNYTADSDGNVNVVMSSTGTHSYELTNPDSEEGGSENTMGNTGEGSVRDSSTANCICAFKYTADSSFTATNVHIKMYDAFSSGHFKVAIYSDNSGTPGSMLGTTNEYTSLAAGWNTLDLSSNVELTSGTSYWLVEWGDAAYAIYGDVSGGTCKWDYYTYGTWPSGGSVSWTSSPGNSSIYAANY